MQERKKNRLFKLQPIIVWGQLNRKNNNILGQFKNEEMLKYVQVH